MIHGDIVLNAIGEWWSGRPCQPGMANENAAGLRKGHQCLDGLGMLIPLDNVRLKRNGPQIVDYRDPALLKFFRHVSGFGCVNGRNFPECRQPKRQIAGRGLGSESCVELVVGNENAPASHENISPSNLIPPGRWLQDRSLKWQIELAPERLHQ